MVKETLSEKLSRRIYYLGLVGTSGIFFNKMGVEDHARLLENQETLRNWVYWVSFAASFGLIGSYVIESM